MDIFEEGLELYDIQSFILDQRNECICEGNHLCLIFSLSPCVILLLFSKEGLEVFLSFYLRVAFGELA